MKEGNKMKIARLRSLEGMEIRSLPVLTIKELKTKIASGKVEVRTLLSTDANQAEAKMVEVREFEKSLKLLEELGEKEERDLKDQKIEGKKEPVNEMRAIVKKLMGKDMTVEERAAINTTDNAAVIPKQFVNKLIELTKGYGSLKDLCDVIPVVKNEGTIPVVDLSGQNALLTVKEGDAIVEGKLVTSDVPFKCAKVGLLQRLTSETVDDAEVEIENLIRKNFVEISVANENYKILKIIQDNAAVVAKPTDYNDICTEIDSALPSVKAGLATIANVTGYVYLKGLKDTTGRKLDLVTVVNGEEYFYNKPLHVVEDTSLTQAVAGNKVFYVANTKEAVKYMDRNQFTVAKSAEAGFNTDTVVLRILKRFDVTKGSVRSIKKIEF
jgi:HK97 family phage major capsid protein